jgi:hypothetical protein
LHAVQQIPHPSAEEDDQHSDQGNDIWCRNQRCRDQQPHGNQQAERNDPYETAPSLLLADDKALPRRLLCHAHHRVHPAPFT